MAAATLAWKVRIAVLLGALSIGLLSWLTMLHDGPSFITTYSWTVVLPYLSLGTVGAYSFWPIVFIVWCLPLLRRSASIPEWSAFLVLMAWVIAVIWYVRGFSAGLTHQGTLMVIALGVVDLVVGFSLLSLYRAGGASRTFGNSILFRWLAVAWCAWAALPWLGEGI